MKTPATLATLTALALATGLPAASLAAAPHDHGAAPAKLQLDNGKRWATDEPLRRGMATLRDAVHGAPAPMHQGTARPADYAALGRRVEETVGGIVKDCKLPPAADAQLHVVIADLVAGADALKGAKDGKAGRAGLLRVNGALEAYARHFDHPGWGKPAH